MKKRIEYDEEAMSAIKTLRSRGYTADQVVFAMEYDADPIRATRCRRMSGCVRGSEHPGVCSEM